MSTEPLWRGPVEKLDDAREVDRLVPERTEVEVWRAGDRTSPTREQVRRAVKDAYLCDGTNTNQWLDLAADKVMALLSGQSPTGGEATDGG